MSEKSTESGRVRALVEDMYGRLSETDVAILEKPLTIGEWSVRDLMSHLIFWQDECAWVFTSTLDGTYERRDYSASNDINAEAVRRYAHLSTDETLESIRSTGLRVADLIDEVDDDLWEKRKNRLAGWVEATIPKHYSEHESDLEVALKTD